MNREDHFLVQIEQLDLLISKFQEKASKLDKPSIVLEEQLKKFKALRADLEKVLNQQFSADRFLEGDWRDLLEQSMLTARIKAAVKTILEAQKNYASSKDFIRLVEQFYIHRYTNHSKYLGKLNLGIEIGEEQYQSYLEKAVEYTLKQKGTATKAVDLSANLILLLKGRLKTEEKGNVIIGPQLNSAQINLGFDSKDIDLPKLTQKLNAIPLIKKWNFGIEDTTLSFSATAIGAYKENKYAQINLAKIGDNFKAAMDVFTTDINASFTKVDLGAAIAASDTKISIDLGSGFVFELGVKIADLSASIKEGLSFAPVQVYGKLELSTEQHKKWFEQYEELMKLTTLKVEIVVNITTSIGLKGDISGSKKVQDAVQKVVKAQEQVVGNQQTEYLKKQETYNDLIEKQENIRKIQKENKYLDRLIEQEYDPTKKEKLLIQRGKRKIKILKDYKSITEHLKREGAGSLEDLKDQVVQKSKALDTAIKKALQSYNQVLDRINKPANKLVAELLQKQASKRLVSLLMKAVPGLNVISLAVDIYDAYTLVSDISAAYMEADTELEIDEELEKLALANAEVDINDMPNIIPTFLWGIGAGGRLTELKKKEVDELQAFFEEHFSEGDESTDFANFLFNYGDYYKVNKKAISNNTMFVDSIWSYYSNSPKNLTTGVAEELVTPFEQTGNTLMFKKANYTIIKGDPTLLGGAVHLNALGIDTKEGQSKQIPFELELTVIKQLDSNNYLLQLKDDFDFFVEGFRSYQIRKEAEFVYNMKKQELLLK